MQRKVILVLTATFATLTGALLLSTFRRRKQQIAREAAKQAKLQDFDRIQELIFENYVQFYNHLDEKTILKQIEEFVKQNYSATQIPSFNLLILIFEVLVSLFTRYNGLEESEWEELALKTLRQMKEHVYQRKRLLSASAVSTSTSPTITANSTTNEVADPYEMSLEEQEFAVKLFTQLVNELVLKQETENGVKQLVRQCYNMSPEAPYIMDKYASYAADQDCKEVLQKLVQHYSKDLKKYKRQLGTCYYRLSQRLDDPVERIQILSKAVELYDDSDSHIERFICYKMLSPQDQSKFQECATDEQRAFALAKHPLHLLYRLSELWNLDEIYEKYFEQFVLHGLDLRFNALKNIYLHLVYAHGYVDGFLQFLEERHAYHSKNDKSSPAPGALPAYKTLHYLFKADALLHKPAFDESLEALQFLIDNDRSFAEQTSRHIDTIEAIRNAFASFPALHDIFHKIKEKFIAQQPPTPAQRAEMFKNIELPSEDRQALIEFGTAAAFVSMAWKPLLQVGFFMELITASHHDSELRDIVAMNKPTKGHHVLLMVLYTNTMTELLKTHPMEESAALCVEEIQSKLTQQ